MKILIHWFERLRNFVDHPLYNPLLSFLAGIDLFVLVVPTDTLVISAFLGKKRRRISPVLWAATGSAIGAMLLAAVIQLDIPLITDRILAPIFHSNAWEATDQFLDKHGVWALALSALSPIPQQPGVALGAFAGMPLAGIFFAVWLGRVTKYAFFAWCVHHAPRLLLLLMGREKSLLEQTQVEGLMRGAPQKKVPV